MRLFFVALVPTHLFYINAFTFGTVPIFLNQFVLTKFLGNTPPPAITADKVPPFFIHCKFL